MFLYLGSSHKASIEVCRVQGIVIVPKMGCPGLKASGGGVLSQWSGACYSSQLLQFLDTTSY